jgi:hypothetical protein
MLVIAYSSNQGYLNMVNRLRRICSEWEIPFKAYDRLWLEGTDFYKSNQEILNTPKGNGLWAWKPYIIMDALHSDDEIIYLDSSVIPEDKECLLNLMRSTVDISSLPTTFVNRGWTKRLCFEKMDCDFSRWWNAPQVWAGVVSAKISGANILSEWLNFCTQKDVISDDPCEGNFDGFIEHRHDQSILTNLLIKFDQPLFEGGLFQDMVDYEAK